MNFFRWPDLKWNSNIWSARKTPVLEAARITQRTCNIHSKSTFDWINNWFFLLFNENVSKLLNKTNMISIKKQQKQRNKSWQELEDEEEFPIWLFSQFSKVFNSFYWCLMKNNCHEIRSHSTHYALGEFEENLTWLKRWHKFWGVFSWLSHWFEF